MSLLNLIANLFIGPLKLVFETIFCIAYYFTGNPGLSIVALSLVMNILVLPLYRQADAMQERARDTDARLRKGVAHKAPPGYVFHTRDKGKKTIVHSDLLTENIHIIIAHFSDYFIIIFAHIAGDKWDI